MQASTMTTEVTDQQRANMHLLNLSTESNLIHQLNLFRYTIRAKQRPWYRYNSTGSPYIVLNPYNLNLARVVSAHLSGRHRICSLQRQAWVGAHSLGAESCKIPTPYPGLGHDCSSRNQRGIPSRRQGATATRHPYPHAFNTVHSADIRRFRATHQRSSTFSLHPKDIREEHRFEGSAVKFGMA